MGVAHCLESGYHLALASAGIGKSMLYMIVVQDATSDVLFGSAAVNKLYTCVVYKMK